MSAPMRTDEIKAKLQGLRVWVAQEDHSLAQEAALATSQPFPDQVHPGQGCKCVFGPRCESNRGCEDEDQTVGIKDRRTGAIRARAHWSFFHPWWSRGPTPRILFYCNDCLEELKAVWGKPIPGITRPAHASEFWRPSIGEHIRLTALENNRQQRMKEPPVYAPGHQQDEPLRRLREMPAAQYAQVLRLRSMMREFRDTR